VRRIEKEQPGVFEPMTSKLPVAQLASEVNLIQGYQSLLYSDWVVMRYFQRKLLSYP
jgi:hypothetical protein